MPRPRSHRAQLVQERAVALDGHRLRPEQVGQIADGSSCTVTAAARARVVASRRVVERALRSGRKVYGVNTGFGLLAQVAIDPQDLTRLQANLIRSHAAGVGTPLTPRVVRAILALRVNCLARGHSGVRPVILETMIGLLDADITPVIPEQGSVGASGDLAPLAHLALALCGEGEVFYRGRRQAASRALARAGIAPLKLQPKEGLALINGTQMMTAIGVLALLDVERLLKAADVIGAMSVDALRGTPHAFDREIHLARPHPGQLLSARNLRRVLRGSAIARSHRDCDRVQDAYSLRCIPQVHGAVRDAVSHVRRVLQIEINSSTDNPMVFADVEKLVSGGNFHGQPVSLALDHLAIATCSLATISERRIERLVNPELSGLSAFLTHEPGLHSGFMLAHVTAAALVAENKILAHPASVDTVPTSGAKEDHVSMGAHAARKAARIVHHVSLVLGIELLCASQALDLLAPLAGGRGVEIARQALRTIVAHLDEDRILSGDIERAADWLRTGALADSVERGVGKLA